VFDRCDKSLEESYTQSLKYTLPSGCGLGLEAYYIGCVLSQTQIQSINSLNRFFTMYLNITVWGMLYGWQQEHVQVY
jgi:hypothetical protein